MLTGTSQPKESRCDSRTFWNPPYSFRYPRLSQLTVLLLLNFSVAVVPRVQSLRSTLGAYPRVGSQLKLYYGKPAFHLRSGQIDVHVIKVGREILSQSPSTWLHVCEKTMPPRTAAGQNCGPEASPLFEAVMLVSDVLSAGCVLIVGFQHSLGDAASYSMFLLTWSNMYAANLRAHRCKLSAASFPTVKLQLPPMVPQQSRTVRRFFTFSAEGADSLKRASQAGCTTNDALMAQVACVLGHIRFAAMGMAAEQAGAARIAIMADRRGRGLPINTWGNHAVDLQIDISFQLLARGDVAAVACGESSGMFAPPLPSGYCVNVCDRVCGMIRLTSWPATLPWQLSGRQYMTNCRSLSSACHCIQSTCKRRDTRPLCLYGPRGRATGAACAAPCSVVPPKIFCR